jgi:integrase
MYHAASRSKKLDPASATIGEHADHEVRFLRLYVSPIGSRVWRIRLREPGDSGAPYPRAKRHTLGHWPELTHEAAREAALIARGAIRRKADPAATLSALEPRTVGKAIEEYLDSPMQVRKKQKPVSPAYQESMRHALRVPVGKKTKDHFAGIRNRLLADLRRRDLQILSETVPVEHMRKLRVFFSWCERREYVEISPAAKIEIPQSGKDPRALISNSEGGGIDWRELIAVMHGLEAFAKEKPDSLWPAVYRLQLFTAMRPEEVTRIKWEDAEIDAEYPTLAVDGKIERRVIPLARAAIRVLHQIQPDPTKRSGWIFPCERAESGHLTVDGTSHRRIVKLAGTKRRWSRKHLRKTVRTWFGERQQTALGRLALGHSLAGMDAHYDGSDPLAAIRKAMNEFCDAVEAQTRPPTLLRRVA